MEELLQKARERFPPGTIFKSPQSGVWFKVEGEIIADGVNIRVNNAGQMPFLLFNDTWAEISNKSKSIDQKIEWK